MNSECIVVCESIYNKNTLKLGTAISKELGCSLISADEALKNGLEDYKLVVLGSGIYFKCHHPAIAEVAQKVITEKHQVLIFSSRGNPFNADYHALLREILVKKGIKVLGEFSSRGFDGTGPFVLIGGGAKGRPNENDLRKARTFVRKTVPWLCKTDHYNQSNKTYVMNINNINIYHVKAGNNLLVLKGDRVTINQNDCQGCGKCVAVCPMGAIHLSENKALPSGEDDCILCELCVRKCDNQAIFLHYNWRQAIGVAKRHGKKVSL